MQCNSVTYSAQNNISDSITVLASLCMTLNGALDIFAFPEIRFSVKIVFHALFAADTTKQLNKSGKQICHMP